MHPCGAQEPGVWPAGAGVMHPLAHGRAEAFERMDGSGQPSMRMHADGGLGQKPLDRATGKPRL